MTIKSNINRACTKTLRMIHSGKKKGLDDILENLHYKVVVNVFLFSDPYRKTPPLVSKSVSRDSHGRGSCLVRV